MNTPPPIPNQKPRLGGFLLRFCGASSIIAALYVVRHPAISEYVRPPAPLAVVFYITLLIGPSVLAFVTLGESVIARLVGGNATVLPVLAGVATASSLFLFPVDEYRFGRDLGVMPMITATSVSLFLILLGNLAVRQK
jgi:hypothetical protein